MFETAVDRLTEGSMEAIAHVQRLYDSGAPILTKGRIREAYQNLQANSQPGQEVLMRALDGNLDKFRVHPPFMNNDSRCSTTDLFYMTMQMSLHPRKSRGKSVYTNIAIAQSFGTGNGLGEQEVEAAFESALETCRISPSWEQLKSTLAKCQVPLVKKIVAFALGSMHGVPEREVLDNRAAFQHALLFKLRDLLLDAEPSIDGEEEFKCYAQDPAYSDADAAVLARRGVTVIPDPEGFLEADEETAVISIGPNVPVKQILVELAKPARLAGVSMSVAWTSKNHPRRTSSLGF